METAKPLATLQPRPMAPDKKKLLLLGLQLLSKSLKVPCAVVSPQKQDIVTVQSEQSPPCSPSKDSLYSALSGSEESEVGSPDANSRKRKRTGSTELTEKEKREKRKMMNRVAAQNARDRKKSYIDDLEKKVAILERQNRQLQAENQNLKQGTTILTSEKKQLELCLADSIQTDIVTGLVKRESPKETPFRSAAETLPKGQPLACLDDAQYELLAQFLQDGGFPSSSPIGRTPDVGQDGPSQQHTALETPSMVGCSQFQLEPTKEVTLPLDYSDTLLAETLSTFTDNNIPSPNMIGFHGDSDSMDFLTETNFNDVLYPCNEPALSEADLENWDLSSLLAAV